MVNTRAKGRRIEREFQKLLEEHCYTTHRPKMTKFAKQNDIFGLFDIVAIQQAKIDDCPESNNLPKDFLSHGRLLFIQVKSDSSGFYKASKHIKAWGKQHILPFDDVLLLVALRLGPKEWRLRMFSYDPDEGVCAEDYVWRLKP